MGTFQDVQRHENLEGVLLLGQAMNESVVLSDRYYEVGVGTLMAASFRDYSFIVYPGPKVVDRGRAEHLPLHFHVRYTHGKHLREVRIKTEDFDEYDGIFIPRTLAKFLKDKDVRAYFTRNTKSVFETGKMEDAERPNFNCPGMYEDLGHKSAFDKKLAAYLAAQQTKN